MQKQVLVSIITPSYNHARFIEDAILSVKNQNYPYIEHIIVDGGSTDETLQILKKYQDTYGMKWLSERDKGAADAINKGFDLAKGEIVGILSSDDTYLTHGAVSRIESLFREYKKVHVVAARGVWMDENGYWIKAYGAPKAKISYEYLKFANSALQPATFFRREVVKKEQHDISFHYAFDWDLIIRIAQKYNILPINDIIGGFRLQGDNKTLVGREKRVAEMAEIVKRHGGKYSWQYLIVLFYYYCCKIASFFPQPIRKIIERGIKWVSILLNSFSHGRITSI